MQHRHDKASFARKGRAGRALVLVLAVLGYEQLCFVRGYLVPMRYTTSISKIQCRVRERRQPVPINKDTRLLTSKIKSAQTADELLDLVDGIVDKPVFNYIHVAATYTKLGNFQKKGRLSPSEVRSNVLLRLEDRLQGMLLRKEVGTQGLSNILWAFANLFFAKESLLKFVPSLAEQVPVKAEDMNPRDLSNNIWAAAQLQDVAPTVLKMVPTLLEQIPSKAGDMNNQDLSNSLWAAALLENAVPEVVSIVPALAAQIPSKAGSMITQQLSNCIWALKSFADASPAVQTAVLALLEKIQPKITVMNAQELANSLEALVFLAESFHIMEQPDVVAAAAVRLNSILLGLKGKDLTLAVPSVVWACGRAKVYEAKLFATVSGRFSSQRAVARIPDWGLCAMRLGFDGCNLT